MIAFYCQYLVISDINSIKNSNNYFFLIIAGKSYQYLLTLHAPPPPGVRSSSLSLDMTAFLR